jgi:hypothetical protein
MTEIRVEEAKLREALASLATEWSGQVDRSDDDLGIPVSVFVADLLETGHAADVLEDLIDRFAPPAQKAAAHVLAEQLGEIWESAYGSDQADRTTT